MHIKCSFVFPGFAKVVSPCRLNSLPRIFTYRRHKFHVSFPQCHVAASSSSSLKKPGFLAVSREGSLHQPGCRLHFIFPLMYNPIHSSDTFSAFCEGFNIVVGGGFYFWMSCVHLMLFPRYSHEKIFHIKSWIYSLRSLFMVWGAFEYLKCRFAGL